MIDFIELAPASPPPLSIRLSDALAPPARRAHRLLCVTGAVGDGVTWPAHHLAQSRARRLLALLVEFGLEQRWALRTRVWRVDGGWQWSVEQIRGDDDDE